MTTRSCNVTTLVAIFPDYRPTNKKDISIRVPFFRMIRKWRMFVGMKPLAQLVFEEKKNVRYGTL